MKIPLFDVDGTLVTGLGKTSGVHGKSYDAALATVYNLTASYKEINVQGMIDPQIIVEIVQTHEISRDKAMEKLPQVFQVMRNYIQEHKHEAHYETLPSVKTLLELLHSKHVLIGLLTGNLIEAAKMKLEPAGLWKYVNFGAYGPEASSLKRVELVSVAQSKVSELLKRDVALSELVIIGDTPKDIECAKQGGITSIGVATGMYTIKNLEQAGADLTVDSLEEQEKILSFLEIS
jgi:phosphoglycolate phosphatase-like HAD superfamily hydrolase